MGVACDSTHSDATSSSLTSTLTKHAVVNHWSAGPAGRAKLPIGTASVSITGPSVDGLFAWEHWWGPG